MSRLDRFGRDMAGKLVERVALVSAALALTCVLGANILSAKLQNGELPLIAFVQKQERARAQAVAARTDAHTAQPVAHIGFVGVDLSATGSIGSPAPVSPCSREK